MQAAARAAGVRICGPNCLGLINAFDNVMATFSQFPDGDAAGTGRIRDPVGAFGRQSRPLHAAETWVSATS